MKRISLARVLLTVVFAGMLATPAIMRRYA
jgi:hypothetical protein